MTKTLLALILLSSFPALAASVGQGVVVDFKDGSSVSGILVELTADTVGVKVGQARASWPRSAVSRIVPKETDEEIFRHLRSLAGSDPENLRRLAAFALGHGLFTDYNRLAKRLGLPLQPQGPAPQEDLPPDFAQATAEANAPAPEPKPAPAPPPNMFATIGSLSADPPAIPDPGGDVLAGSIDPFAQDGRMILSQKQAQWYEGKVLREAAERAKDGGRKDRDDRDRDQSAPPSSSSSNILIQQSGSDSGSSASAPATATLVPPGASAAPPSPSSSNILIQQSSPDGGSPAPVLILKH